LDSLGAQRSKAVIEKGVGAWWSWTCKKKKEWSWWDLNSAVFPSLVTDSIDGKRWNT
jgi:hypothetical protein